MNADRTNSPDAAPAHALWVQLTTRVATQPLHYRSGEEESAAMDFAALFEKVRGLLEAHPQAQQFRQVALRLLNETLRPYTARWHGWMTQDKDVRDEAGEPVLRFRDEQVRRRFRYELQVLRPQLLACQARLAQLAGLEPPPGASPATCAWLGKGLITKVSEFAPIRQDQPGLARVDDLSTAECATLLQRRQMWKGQQTPCKTLVDSAGLALSGGGIRSATFCLGVVQTLVRQGLLPQFDYLSTVSGGGYFGSFLSCALGTNPPSAADKTPAQLAAEKIKQVFHRQEEASRRKGVESALVRHLRNHSKYLLHGGFLGRMRLLGLLLSGLLWNLMITLPIPLGAALLAYLLGDWVWGDSVLPDRPALPAITGSFAGWLLLGTAGLLGLGWTALPAVQLWNHGRPPKSTGAKFRNWWEGATLRVGLAAALAAIIFLVPAVFHGYEWVRATLGRVRVGGLNLEALAGWLPMWLTGLGGTLMAALAGWLGPKWPRLRSLAVKLFILSGPLLLLLVFLLVGNRLGIAREGGGAWDSIWVGAVTLGLVAWGWFCVNVNTLAPHRYYRNRLCECYLVRRLAEDQAAPSPRAQKLAGEPVQGSVEVLKQVPLSGLGEDLTAPYHLVNMTVNAPTSANKNLRGRGGDFFLASRHFCGSPLTGYTRTEEVEKTDPHFDLGTAMAVSGAAASSSMGIHTLPHFRFLLTLFNVRLGYWLRRPGVKARPRLLEGAGPWYLFREMLGQMDERCRYVNLSDGGHIENLAVYELLRRRCKFIVCVDGGCDPTLGCPDLLRLQRYAEIDLGVRLYFDTADLQRGPKGLSRAHAILVKIDYEPDPTTRHATGRVSDQLGWMLYVKLAMTGVEPNYVKDYQRENPDFPHQSTGDQVYDEAQFEAYRALGECAMEEMFRAEIVGEQPPRTIRGWFQCLANKLLPDNDEAFRAGQAPAAKS
jgi:hypothetical protein